MSVRQYSSDVSKAQQRLLSTFPDLNFKDLTPPPGVAGSFVCELGQMLTNPYLEYCLPTVLFGLSAFHGRRVKDNGDPIYIYSFVTGKLFTGKTRTATQFQLATGSALAGFDANPSDRTKRMPSPPPPQGFPMQELRSPIHNGKFKSPHELHRQLIMHNTYGALMDEAANAVRAFLDSTTLAVDFKSYIKEAWDAGKAASSIAPPQSKEGSRSGAQAKVYNPNIPIYATCTEDELADMNVKELVDGFWSRWIICFNEFECAEMLRKPETLRKAFSQDLGSLIRLWQEKAATLDEMYIPNTAAEGAPQATEITYARLLEIEKELVDARWSSEGLMMIENLSNILIGITQDAQRRNGKFPKWFEIMARSGIMIRRISCLLAAADNYMKPTVTVEHVKWATEYVVYWTSTLLTAHEDGKVAVSLDDGPRMVVDKMRDTHATGLWISEADLWRKCRYIFQQMAAKTRGMDARKMFGQALNQLHEDGIIHRGKIKQGATGTYEVSALAANVDHKEWDN